MRKSVSVPAQLLVGVTAACATFEKGSDGDSTSRTLVAKNGWFSKLIRMDMNDKTMKKVTKAHFDEKVDTFLKWPEAK